MKYSVIIAPQALAEIEKAYQWLLEQTPQHAPLWHNGLLDAICSLEDNPTRCPTESPVEDSRYLLYGDKHHAYRIIFSIRDREIWISHVWHAARKR